MGWTEKEEARDQGGWDATRMRWLGKIPRLEGELIAETLRLINTVGCWAAEQLLFYCIRQRTGELRAETDGGGGIHTPLDDLLHEPRKFLPNHWPPFYLLLEIGNYFRKAGVGPDGSPVLHNITGRPPERMFLVMAIKLTARYWGNYATPQRTFQDLAMEVFRQYRRYSIAELLYLRRGGKANPAIAAMGGGDWWALNEQRDLLNFWILIFRREESDFPLKLPVPGWLMERFIAANGRPDASRPILNPEWLVPSWTGPHNHGVGTPLTTIDVALEDTS